MTDIPVGDKLAALVARWEAEDRAKRADEIANFCADIEGRHFGQMDLADVEGGIDSHADQLDALAERLGGRAIGKPITKAEAADLLTSLADSLRDVKTDLPDPDGLSIDFGDMQSARTAAESLHNYHTTEARDLS